ncbi:MAG: response regulator [Desulfomonile sp.]|nr:response regulator [Desulfomonile sp.]
MQGVRALIVEKEAAISAYLRASLLEKGYEVVGSADGIEEAIEVFRDSGPNLVIVDTQLGGPLEMAEAARAIRTVFQSDIAMVFLTSRRIDPSDPRLYEHCISKPFSDGELHAKIRAALGSCKGFRTSAAHLEPS